MRRTNQAATRHLNQPASFWNPISAIVRLIALFVLAAAEAHAQEKVARAANPAAGVPSKSERRIVVSIPDRKLALIEDGRVVKVYPVAVGARVSPSPTGEFRVRERITDPSYYAPGKVIPPGKSNPLGTRWIGLGHRGYGIHGTNEPRSIGKSASHGCIRMRNRDVEEFFELVRAGDVVELHSERTDEIAQIFGSGPATKPAATAVSVGGM